MKYSVFFGKSVDDCFVLVGSDGEVDVVVNGDLCKLSKGLIEGGVVEEINDILVVLVLGV